MLDGQPPRYSNLIGQLNDKLSKGTFARLTGGHAGRTGRVEVSKNGTDWATVCDDLWTDREAQIVCRQLLFQWGTAYTSATFGEGEGDIYLDNVQCTGTERNLEECQHNGWGNNNCRHYEDAGVVCYNISVKRSTESDATMGAVQVYHNNQWYAVCDSSFDNRDARVVCRTLGFVDGKAVHGSAFGNLTVPIGVNYVHCHGYEKSFKECKNIRIQHVLQCFDVRIRPDYGKKTANYHGFLEVHIDGVWGSVCGDDSWDDKAANVSCLQMGYKGVVAYKPPKNFTSLILMDSVKCTGGSEPSLHSCSYKPWTKLTGCDYYSQRAGVFCYNDSGLVFRLGEGEADRGRVEMKYNGVWGGICDWLWDSRDAKVFCRNIGYADGLEKVGARYGHSGGPLWFTRVSCKGHEASILQCRHTGFNSSDEMEGVYAGLCRSRSNDAAAQCYSQTLKVTRMRLVNSDKKLSYGRVEVYMSGANQWGTVCDDYWGDKDAKVVCRQMGYADGMGVKVAHFGRGTGPIWLDNLRCLGNETKLEDCPHNSFAVQNCNHGKDAGVYCTDFDVRIRPDYGKKTANHHGFLEVHIDDVWGGVCGDDSWDDKAATVACRMMGYKRGVAYKTPKPQNFTSPILIDSVKCTGRELSLHHCWYDTWNKLTGCDFYSQRAGVFCYNYYV